MKQMELTHVTLFVLILHSDPSVIRLAAWFRCVNITGISNKCFSGSCDVDLAETQNALIVTGTGPELDFLVDIPLVMQVSCSYFQGWCLVHGNCVHIYACRLVGRSLQMNQLNSLATTTATVTPQLQHSNMGFHLCL